MNTHLKPHWKRLRTRKIEINQNANAKSRYNYFSVEILVAGVPRAAAILLSWVGLYKDSFNAGSLQRDVVLVKVKIVFPGKP